jgi:hypothetical protein
MYCSIRRKETERRVFGGIFGSLSVAFQHHFGFLSFWFFEFFYDINILYFRRRHGNFLKEGEENCGFLGKFRRMLPSF